MFSSGGKLGEGRAGAPGDQALLQRDKGEEMNDKGEEMNDKGEDGLRQISENIRESLSDTQRKILLL